jgi:hypothetical protein
MDLDAATCRGLDGEAVRGQKRESPHRASSERASRGLQSAIVTWVDCLCESFELTKKRGFAHKSSLSEVLRRVHNW